MSLPAEVSKNLIEVFTWAAQDYQKSIKEHKIDEPTFFGYDIEEPEIQKYVGPIRTYFLDPPVWEGIQVCHPDRVTGQKPPPSNEALFARAFEQLLLWAAISLSMGIPRRTASDFLQQFEVALSKPPRKLSYIPIYGTQVQSQSDFYKPLVLATGVVARNLQLDEYTFLKNECRGISLDPKQRTRTDLPVWVIEIDHDEIKRAGLAPEDVTDTVSRFIVLCRGLFHAPIRLPITIEGHQTAWYPFDYEGGRTPRVAIDPGWHPGFSDMEMKAFRMHWEKGNFEPLERFRIATSRLEMAEERSAWHDQLIDLCIALESLYGFRAEMTFKYAALTAALLESDYEPRQKVYSLIKRMFDWRGKVVHGDPKITKLQEKTTPDKFKQDLGEFKRYVEQVLLIQLLNPNLRDEDKLVAPLLGLRQDIVKVPTKILQAKIGS